MKALLAMLLLTAPLRAAELEFGVRGGYAALGSRDQNEVVQNFSALIPLALTLGYRPAPRVYAGLYLEYAFGLSSCPLVDRPDCSGHAAGFGAELRYSFSPEKRARPWIGLSLGYQRVREFVTEEEFGRFANAYDAVLFGAEAGIEVYATRHLSIGPYFAGKAAVNFFSSFPGTYFVAEAGLRVSFALERR